MYPNIRKVCPPYSTKNCFKYIQVQVNATTNFFNHQYIQSRGGEGRTETYKFIKAKCGIEGVFSFTDPSSPWIGKFLEDVMRLHAPSLNY